MTELDLKNNQIRSDITAKDEKTALVAAERSLLKGNLSTTAYQKTMLEFNKTQLQGAIDSVAEQNTLLLAESDQLLININNNTEQRATLNSELDQLSCYYFSNDTRSWFDSHIFCRAHGADLVIIEEQDEHVYLTSKIKEHMDFLPEWNGTWIGLSDMFREGTFTWVNNKILYDPNRIQQWVQQMQDDLVSLIDTESGMQNLIQIYQNHKKHYSVEFNNATELVSNAARNIEKLLLNRSEALHRLAKAAEEFQMVHQWNDGIEEKHVSYYNAKDSLNSSKKDNEEIQSRITPEFHEDPTFKRLISYNQSAVHIPTDIYEGSTIVLNELNWTAALDEVFKANKEEDPSLLWQVFGSATGLARYYPASPWKKSRTKRIDLYDVRRRPWYIQGAASPKDMLILVDASGSVSGLTLKLIRTSVITMLETLSDDDYVNVVQFNEEANTATCFQNLVQANVRNKKALKEAVENITAKGITNYKGGFEMAFQQLAVQNVSRANCNKIIMLFTDGGEERASEIFARYNSGKQQVRIFTFSVGQHNYDKVPIQWMACTNKGYYYEIPSIGAIRINTQEYLDVLGRPMVKADELAKKVQWTNVYMDALDLGLVITGTLPVFNKTDMRDPKNKNKDQNQLILGVMGIDVSLEDIKVLTPGFTFGPNGYYFAIDPNGYVLLHPNLKPENFTFHEPVTLDFLDAELEDEIKVEIRKSMINGEKGDRNFSTLVKSQDERYIDRGRRTYTWGPVKDTGYSLALVLPDYSLHYIQPRIGDTITQAKFSESLQVDNFEEYGYTFVAARDYCKDLKPSGNNTEFLINFNEYIDRKTPNDPLCNAVLVNRLLLDAGITSELVKHWSQQSVNDRIISKFVATDGGITRVYPSSAGPDWTKNVETYAETYEFSFYKRNLDNDLYVFTPSVYVDNNTESSILVSKAVDLDIDGVRLKPAVVGVQLDINRWVDVFINATMKTDPSRCKEEICGCRRNDAEIDCVLLDDGGFLVMSNQDDYISQIGQFFGVIDPILMKNLLNMSLFSFKKTYDYQSVCPPKREPKAAAGPRSVYVPTIVDILNVGWWASAAAWSILQQLFVSITFPSFLEAAEPDDDLSDSESLESCITEQTQYFFENNDRTFNSNIDCKDCTRLFHAEKLWKTNLVFVIAEAKETCQSCDKSPLIQAEQPSTGPDPCLSSHSPRYRKGPDVCFDNNESEQDVDCGGASGLSPPLWSIAILQLLLLWQLIGLGHCLS
ncbi:voltage-dependent calcium channel subunit alpha-2/delta-1a [Chanos chanos]|uniref:Voltage-dependent calcium channel subunit alpha-2/delta-1a n=1 Tax=Chanos chanos TaxID=29144 RepID=A0A6J2VIE5_CHACN|nr:voltage-dependent calcium channel subunit alpha-2/delta-1-like [Chanos chanos]